MSDEKPETFAYVRLKLHDPTIVDLFICYSEAGMEAEPAHRVLVHLKGDYDVGSDKLELNGQQIPLHTIQITGVSTKEDCLKSHATQNYISINMINHVFAPFLELMRSNTQTGEIVLKLDAWPLNERFLRLSFDGGIIRLTYQTTIPILHEDTGMVRLWREPKSISAIRSTTTTMRLAST